MLTLKILTMTFLIAVSSFNREKLQSLRSNNKTNKVPRIESLSLRYPKGHKSNGACQESSPTDSSLCKSCLKGFYLLKGNCVKQTVDGCAEYIKNTNICKRMISRQNNARVLVSSPVRSLLYSIANKCIQCKNLFYLNSDYFCAEIKSENCLLSDGKKDACLYCESKKFSLTENGECVLGTVLNCAEFGKTPEICSKCESLFYLSVDYKCLAINEVNCSESSGEENKCRKCKNLFYRNITGLCNEIQDKNMCGLSNGVNNKCEKCLKPIYVLLKSGVCEQGKIENCVEYVLVNEGETNQENEYKCKKCKSRFYLTVPKTCAAITAQNCASSNGISDDCTSCLPYFKRDSATVCSCDYANYVASQSNNLDCSFCSASPPKFVDNQCACQTYADVNCEAQKQCLNECETCEDDYFLDPTTKRCFPSSNNCQAYNSAGTECAQCNSLDKVIDSSDKQKCIDRVPIDNCKEHVDSKHECEECDSLFYVTVPKTCAAITAQNCASSNGISNECEECDSLFYVTVPKTCAAITAQNCASSNGISDDCTSCLPYFKRDSATVCSCDYANYVASQSNNLDCSFCSASPPKFVDNQCACQTYADVNCEAQKQCLNECETCEDDYFLDPTTKRCFPSSNNCQAYNSAGTECAQCNSLDKVIDSSDKQKCIDRVPIDNCKEHVDSKHECEECDSLFYVTVPKTCAAITAQNCASSNGISNECEECDSLFYVTVPKTCAAITAQNCASSNGISDDCTSCLPYFKRDSATVCSCDYANYVASQSNNLDCSFCSASPPKFVDNQCACQTYADVNCEAQKQCLNECETCEDDYFLDPTTKRCFPSSNNCQAYNSAGTECAQCNSLDKVIDSSDKQKCIDRVPIDNCKEHVDSKHECEECDSLFYVTVPKTCAAITAQNCASSNGISNECEECDSLFYVTVPKTCAAITAQNCASSNGISDDCTSCLPYFKRDSATVCSCDYANYVASQSNNLDCSFCSASPPKFVDNQCACQTYADVNCEAQKQCLNECETCEDDYFLDPTTKRCFPSSNNCQAYNSAGTECAQCNSLDKVIDSSDKQKCIDRVPIDNCKEHVDSKHECEECDSLFYVTVPKTCAAITAQNCASSNGISNECEECDSLFYVTVPKTCAAITAQNCASSNGISDDCTSCLPYFKRDSATVCSCDYANYVASQSNNLDCSFCSASPPKFVDNQCACQTYADVNCEAQKQCLNECETCEDDYFLDPTTKRCFPSSNNCQAYNSAGTECAQCNSLDKVIDSSDKQKCIDRVPIDNCKEHVDSKHECEECDSLFYVTVPKTCAAITAQNCASSNGISNECEECDSLFYVTVPKTCAAITAQNCASSNGISNECEECDSLFYVTVPKTCAAITAQNCASSNGISNECEECDSLFYVTVPKTCAAITAQNCASSNGISDDCTSCLPYFKRDSATVCSCDYANYVASQSNNLDCSFCSASPPKFVDNQCACQTYADVNCEAQKQCLNECETCEDDYFLDPTTKRCFPSSNNCQAYNSAGTECAQCNSLDKVIDSSDKQKCIDRVPIDNCKEHVDSKHECEECDSLFYVTVPKTCAAITAQNCASSNGISNECEECDSLFYVTVPKTCAAITAQNCASSNGISNECEECDSLFYVTVPKTCAAITAQNCASSNGISNECEECDSLFYVTVPKTCAAITAQNCASSNGISDDCTSCLPYFKRDSATVCSCDYANYVASQSNNLDCSFCSASPPKFVDNQCACQTYADVNCEAQKQCLNECETCEDDYFLDPTTKRCFPSSNNCQAYNSAGTECAQCNSLDKVIDSSDKQKCIDRVPIDNCKEHVDSKHECEECDSLFYVTVPKTCAAITAQNCASSNGISDECQECDSLFYVTVPKTCAAITAQNCASSNGISNECEECDSLFYVTVPKTCAAITAQNCASSNGISDDCTSCLPYFKRDSATVCSCDYANYVASQSNNLDCSFCSASPPKFVDNQCACQTYADVNCEAQKQCLNECETCEDDYFLDPTTKRCFPSSNNCQAYNSAGTECAQCNSLDKVIDSSDKQKCIDRVPIDNCKEHVDSKHECEECDSLFYVTVPKTCAAITAQNCASSNGISNECEECDSLFYVTVPKTCAAITAQNCASSNGISDDCTSCLPYFKRDSATVCSCDYANYVASQSNNLDCSFCSASPPKFVDNQCACQTYADVNCEAQKQCLNECETCEDDYFLDPTTKRCFPSSNNCQAYNSAGTECAQCNSLDKVIDSSDKQKCIDRVPIDNCKEHVDSKHECEECDSLFYVTVPKTCAAITAQNCASSNGISNECEECDSLFYVTVPKTCAAITAQNCASSNGISDECQECDSLFYVTVPKTCAAITAQNCASSNGISNECEECDSLFYVTVPKTCAAITAQNCASSNGISDDCTSCLPYFKRDSATVCSCDYANYVASQSNNLDCSFCSASPPKFVDNQCACQTYADVNCEAQKQCLNECETCEDDYFLDPTTKRCFPSSNNCQAYNSAGTECAQCNSLDKVIDSSDKQKCIDRVPIDNCKEHVDSKHECEECDSLFYVTVPKTCAAITAQNCASSNGISNECEECDSLFYVTVPKTCAAITAQNCASSNGISDDCTSCLPYFKRDSATVCSCDYANYVASQSNNLDCSFCSASPPKFVDNQCACQTYADVNCEAQKQCLNECETCEDDYFLDPTTKRCFPSSNNCQAYNSAGTECAQCNSLDKVIDSSDKQKCIDRVPIDNCKEHVDSKHECEECDSLFYVTVPKTCAAITAQNCASSNGISNECEECDSLFYVTVPKTCAAITAQNCASSNGISNECEECDSLFYVTVPKTCAAITAQNCASSNGISNECEECDSLFYVTVPKTCAAITAQNCASSNGISDDCTSCLPYFKRDSATVCSCDYANYVASQSNNLDCSFCSASPPKFVDNQCACQTYADVNCEAQKQCLNECETCEDDYFLDPTTKRCFPSSNNCQAYNSAGTECAQCNSLDKVIDSSDKQKCIDRVPIDNCKEHVDSKHECEECDSLFYVTVPKTCAAITAQNCASSNGISNECEECDSLFYVTVPKTCAAITAQNCASSNGISDDCTSCLPYFKRDSATVCSCDYANYVASQSNNLDCSFCSASPPKFVDNQCACQTYADVNCEAQKQCLNECETCEDDYFLDPTTKRCFPSSNNCQAYNSAGTECAQCNSLDKVIDSSDKQKCIDRVPIDNCKEHVDSKHECEECDSLFYVTVPKTCAAITAQNCASSNGISNECEECDSLFYVTVPKTCAAITAQNCASSNGISDECQECDSLFYVTVPKTCAAITAQNCASSNGISDECQECDSLFYVTVPKTCAAITAQNCASSNGISDECQECDSLFNLTPQKTCLPA
jgi:hypothetical protein